MIVPIVEGAAMRNRPLRADARRNRARVLEVAAEAFATEGLGVPVHEIARRAGVGTGTVSRHFPTKEDLFAAILLERMAALADEGDRLTATCDPGTAFGTYFAIVVRIGETHRGLAEALAGAGFDIDAAGVAAGFDVSGKLSAMLSAAQRAGAVRSDIAYADIKALMLACMAREGGLDPLLAVITQGLHADGR
jgi:AcrR family transcriptional regulator